jgi:hypothetical protein
VIRHVQPEAEEAPAHPGAPDRAPNKKGMNRFVWDLQYPDAAWFSRMVLWTGFLQGPAAVPGTYTVKLTVGDKTESQTFVLKNDPRSTASQKDLEEQFALQIKIRDAVSAANNGVRTIRNVKAQMAARVKQSGDANLRDRTNALAAKLSTVEAQLYSVQNRAGQDMLNYPIKLNDQLGSLYNTVSSADGKPTAQSYEVFKELNTALDKQLAALKQALDSDLPGINSKLSDLKLAPIVPGTADLGQ